LADIERRLSDFYDLLIELYRDLGRGISFMELISGLGALEAIRRFIMLLFLANDGKVELLQEDGIGDIKIIPRIEAT
jgi:segregation and condensation protein A